MDYESAIEHIREYKQYYSIKKIAEYMGIAPSMLRNIIDKREIKNKNRSIYVQRMPEKHKSKFIECIEMLTGVSKPL